MFRGEKENSFALSGEKELKGAAQEHCTCCQGIPCTAGPRPHGGLRITDSFFGAIIGLKVRKILLIWL